MPDFLKPPTWANKVPCHAAWQRAELEFDPKLGAQALNGPAGCQPQKNEKEVNGFRDFGEQSRPGHPRPR
jgi:hypothetical protein